MTLKAYCSKIRAILKRQVWLAALWFVVLFFAQPVFTALLISDQRYSSSYPQNVADNLLQVFSQESLTLVIILMIMAFISALVSGGYMHRQRQVDFYHSQPMPRHTLLLQHSAAGLLSIIIPYIASQLLTIIVALAMGVGAYFPWLEMLIGFLTHTLFLTAIFLSSMIAVAISGNGAVAMLTGLFLLGVGPALMGLFLLIMDQFYPVFYESLYQWDMIVRWLSPAAAYVCLPINGLPYTIFPIIVFNLLAALGLLAIYRKRPSEMAGQAMAFKPVKAPLKYAMALVAATVMALIFNSIGNHGNSSEYFWWYFGAIAGAFLATQITEIVYAFDFRAILRNLRGLGIFLVIYLALTTCAMRDITGFNRSLPASEQVASAQVYLPGLDRMAIGGYYYGNNYRDPQSELSLLQMDERDMLAMGPVSDPAAIEALLHMAGVFTTEYLPIQERIPLKEQQQAELTAAGKEYLFSYGSYDSPYINSYPTQTNMRVVFTLNNGRTLAREYQYQKPVQFLIEDLRVIYDQADFRTAQLARLNHADDHYLPEYLQIFELYYPPAPLPQFTLAQRGQLMAALRADMLELSVAEQEQTEPIGLLNLRMYGGAVDYSELEAEQNGLHRPHTTQRVAIYPSFNRTLSFLAEFGYSAKLWQPQLEAIQTVKLYDMLSEYRGDKEMYGYGVTVPMTTSSYAASSQLSAMPEDLRVTEVTDPAEIAEIIAKTYPTEATEYNSFIDIDRRVETEVWYVGADGQSYIMRRVFAF